MQDTATQAMTEVALGLSMAFFALLILALISIGLPNNNLANEQGKAGYEIERSLELNSDSQQETINDDKAVDARAFVFYWQGRWFDANMQEISLKSINHRQNIDNETQNQLVVVVTKSTPFEDLLTIKTNLDSFSIELAEMTSEWQNAFTQAGY